MKPTEAFRNYNRNKFYNSIFIKTKELEFQPDYLSNDKDRTNFGNKLDWSTKTKEVEALISKAGLKVFLKDSNGDPILEENSNTKIYRNKKILHTKNDVSFYTNIKNYYESNNRFFEFTRKRKNVKPPVYEIIEQFFIDLYVNLQLLSQKSVLSVVNSTLDLNLDILSKKNKLYVTFSELDLNIYINSIKECNIHGGRPNTTNFSYMLLGGHPNTVDSQTIEQWCQTNQS